MRRTFATALLGALSLVPTLFACSTPDAPLLAGTYRVSLTAALGALDVNGTGHITLGADCTMDVTVTVSSSLGDSVRDPAGSYRFTRPAGGPTAVSRDGGSPIDVQDPDAPSPGLASLLPLTVSPYPLPGHGDFLCALGAIPSLTVSSPSGALTWDTAAAAALHDEAARAYHASLATLAGLTDQQAVQYISWAAEFEPPLQTEPFTEFVSALDHSGRETTYRQRLASNDARFNASITLTDAAWSPGDLPDVEPYANRRAAELSR